MYPRDIMPFEAAPGPEPVGLRLRCGHREERYLPRAACIPLLRAAPGPPFDERLTTLTWKANPGARRSTPSAVPSVLQSSATITSKSPAGQVCAVRQRRHAHSRSRLLCAGITTLMSGRVNRRLPRVPAQAACTDGSTAEARARRAPPSVRTTPGLAHSSLH